MASLTPKHREAEAVADATYEGFFNGLVTFIPSVAIVGLALRHSPAFALRTNWQSRTAIAVMPAFFVTALTGEQKLSHKMREIASEHQHSTATVLWAENELKLQQQEELLQLQSVSSTSSSNVNKNGISDESPQQQQQPSSTISETQRLAAMYQQSVAQSGVCIVNGELQWYHKAANYTAQNPVKVLTAIAVPTIGYIFYGRTEQTHLALSSQIMHTRVFGQFATISLLLGIMGFKEFMDTNGRFISQQQANDRVIEMQLMRQQLLDKLEREKQHAAELKHALEEAHEQDLLEHNNNNTAPVRRRKKKIHNNDNSKPQESQVDDNSSTIVTATTPLKNELTDE